MVLRNKSVIPLLLPSQIRIRTAYADPDPADKNLSGSMRIRIHNDVISHEICSTAHI
jgi:hypothetical protein